jgi:Ca2+-binding EF-hand superfamily protein
MYIHQKGSLDEKLDRMISVYFNFSSFSSLYFIVAFKVYDLHGNGFIEREELMKLATQIHKYVDLSQQHKKNKGKYSISLLLFFAAMRCGSSSSHLISLSPLLGQSPEERVTYLLNLMDQNKDGKISQQEFREGVKKDPEIAEGIKSCVFRVI